MSRSEASFMSGVPEFVILRLLAREEMYGYELVRNIKLTSENSLTLAEGVIYPTLHSLENKGLLKTREKEVKGRTRIYYRTTAKGLKRLDKMNEDWVRITTGIEAIMRRLSWGS